MTAKNFPTALAFLLRDEGGNDDDPSDHGGRTSRGVTQREYDAWRRALGKSTRDVWTADVSEISTIYHDEYWNPLCDGFPAGIDYLYFDMAVNAGPYRAAVLLQRALGITDDGRIGPITREAVGKADPKQLIAAYATVKQNYYRSLHQPKFIRGWLNRVAHVQANANTMLESST